MAASFDLKSLMRMTVLAGTLCLMAGCAEMDGNPTGKGATPISEADHRIDNATRVPDVGDGGTGTAGTGAGSVDRR